MQSKSMLEITNLYLVRCIVKRDGKNIELSNYIRCPLSNPPSIEKEGLSYVNPCNNLYIRNSEYEASKFPEGCEL